jgi:trans-aconitate methyltransferase
VRLAGNSRIGLNVPAIAIQPAKWNAADYAANSVIQQTWARELISKLNLRGDEHILDIGCGDGKVTAEIARALPRGLATGIDASPQMIKFAKKTFPDLKFRVMDARKIKFARRFDFVFSNAALHWVDDHRTFLRGASSVLKRGGRLVVSCGGRRNAHDVFVAMCPVMRNRRWREFFRRMPTPYFFYAPEDYEKWLPKFGFKPLRVELVQKDAGYDGAEGFATWLRTTWIPFVQRVPENVREEFIAAVIECYVVKHPLDAEGIVHVKMVRLEIDAIKV